MRAGEQRPALRQIPALTPPARVLADRRARSVLLVRLRVGLGDLLCTVPALRALRRARPDLHIALSTWAEMAPVVDRFPAYVDELVPFPGVRGIPEREPSGSLSAWADELRSRGFDLAVQMYGQNDVANDVTERAGARVTGGFARAGRAGDVLHLPYPTRLHEVHRHLALLQHLGVPADGSAELEWPVHPDDEHEAARLRPDLPYVVLHPGATSPSRRWPPERFAAVGDALVRAGLQVLVGGVAAESAETAAVCRAMTAKATDLTGRTSLGAYAVLLRDAAVVVSNDTGTAHLSAAVGGRCVTVFQSGDPSRWQHAPSLQTVVRSDADCSPCPHLRCPIDFRCATGVSPEQVVRAARNMLAGAPPR